MGKGRNLKYILTLLKSSTESSSLEWLKLLDCSCFIASIHGLLPNATRLPWSMVDDDNEDNDGTKFWSKYPPALFIIMICSLSLPWRRTPLQQSGAWLVSQPFLSPLLDLPSSWALNKLCKKPAAHQFENFTLPWLFQEYYCFYTKINRRALMWVVVVVVVVLGTCHNPNLWSKSSTEKLDENPPTRAEEMENCELGVIGS